MTMIIRSAKAEDVGALVVIEEQAFRTDLLSRRAFRHHISNRSASMIVAEEDGVVQGYALIFHAKGQYAARLYSLAVAESVGGRGIGRQLLEAAEARARELGRQRMLLEVRTDNATAIRLYQTAGYGQPTFKPQFYGDGATALRLTKDLANRT